jgi:hypothetical protein
VAILRRWHPGLGNEKNYVQFERTVMRYPDGTWRCYPNWQQHRNGDLLEDRADYGFSLDEQTPTMLPPIKTQLSRKLMVGVAAIQNSPSGYEAVFENLKFYSGKKTE